MEHWFFALTVCCTVCCAVPCCAVPVLQNRNRILQQAASSGSVKDYGGWRVSLKGKRFRIKDVRLFNVTELDGEQPQQQQLSRGSLACCRVAGLAVQLQYHQQPAYPPQVLACAVRSPTGLSAMFSEPLGMQHLLPQSALTPFLLAAHFHSP